jgi:crossover junction endodeoxyribonuclease RusA
MEISLPWPASCLSPNARSHWRKVGEAKKAARTLAKYVALDAINRNNWPKNVTAATTYITFVAKDDRKRDGDNHLAMLKAYLDGLADAGVIANDCGFTHSPVRFVKGEDRSVIIEVKQTELTKECIA